MTERDWDECTVAERLLTAIGEAATIRKLRLFRLACCRWKWRDTLPALAGEWAARHHHVLELAERLADGAAKPAEILAAVRFGYLAYFRPLLDSESDWKAPSRFEPELSWQFRFLYGGPHDVVDSMGAVFLKDLFGNPFRTVHLDSTCLNWSDRTIPAIAQRIYDEARPEDLPVLGDALEEAGCTERSILEHARSSGPHVRGCWLVDLLLGKS